MENIRIKDKYGNRLKGVFKKLDITYIDKIMELQKDVVDSLIDKEFYASMDREGFIEYIENGAYILGCVTQEDDLIAMGVYIKFGYGECNYGYDLDIKGDELLKVGQIEATIVKEAYRGNRLQHIMCRELEDIAKGDDVRVLGATVAPKNIYSLSNFKNSGYTVEKEKLKYGNYLRCILKKEL